MKLSKRPFRDSNCRYAFRLSRSMLTKSSQNNQQERDALEMVSRSITTGMRGMHLSFVSALWVVKQVLYRESHLMCLRPLFLVYDYPCSCSYADIFTWLKVEMCDWLRPGNSFPSRNSC
nr:hypothetical protein [Bidens alba var. radiata]